MDERWVEGRIEQIEFGTKIELFGRVLYDYGGDQLCISNRNDYLWVLSLISGYRQLGVFKVPYGSDFKEGEDVLVRMCECGRSIVEVKRVGDG